MDVYRKLEQINTRLEKIEETLTNINSKLDKLESSCSNMDEHISFVESTYNYLQKFSFFNFLPSPINPLPLPSI